MEVAYDGMAFYGAYIQQWTSSSGDEKMIEIEILYRTPLDVYIQSLFIYFVIY